MGSERLSKFKTHRSLKASEHAAQEGAVLGEDEHASFNKRALSVVVLQDYVLLQCLDCKVLRFARVFQFGKHDLKWFDRYTDWFIEPTLPKLPLPSTLSKLKFWRRYFFTEPLPSEPVHDSSIVLEKLDVINQSEWIINGYTTATSFGCVSHLTVQHEVCEMDTVH